MVTKKLNVGILIISQALHFIVLLCFAVLLAKIIWWMITPAYNTVYVEKVKINQKDSPVKFIINRYPFGEVIAYKAPTELPVATQIKLNGVYLDAENSLAFINYNNKSVVVKSGGEIASGIRLDKINLDSILIVQNGQEAVVKISNRETSGDINLNNNQYPSLQQRYPNNNVKALPNTQNTQLNNNDFKEERKKIIERFAKQNVDNSSNENQSNNKTSILNNNVNSTNNTNIPNNTDPTDNVNSVNPNTPNNNPSDYNDNMNNR